MSAPPTRTTLLLLLLCALLPLLLLPGGAAAAAAAPLCDTPACARCAQRCASYAAVRGQQRACARALPLAAAVWPWDAYVQCASSRCVPRWFDHVCGLLPSSEPQPPPHSAAAAADDDDDDVAHALRALHARLQRVSQRRQQLRARTHARLHALRVNGSMLSYHARALSAMRRCDRLLVAALRTRASYERLRAYKRSLEYRVLKQEVTRLRFENDDFARHLRFWRRHNRSLQLVVRTSPRALRLARDALFSEMREYQTDALLIKALRNGSYSKERQARFTVRLRNKVRRQLERLRTRNAMLAQETLFIAGARTELYNLLRGVWRRMSVRRLRVGCGADVLSHAVTRAFKDESHLL